MRTITTVTGREVDPLALSEEDIDLFDIAHALGNLCRYVGHCQRFYSVAEHSILISRLCPPEYALVGLLHDAAEIYLGDVASPTKPLYGAYRDAEERAEAVIARRFGYEAGVLVHVKPADVEARQIEMAQLMPRGPAYSSPIVLDLYLPEEGREAFLTRFHELAGPRGLA